MLLKKMKKKGISPVIATVLLIALVIVIALIIFLWFRGMVGEGAEKFGKNIELVCEDVDFEAEYALSSGTLNIVNIAYVPIFRVNLKIEGSGTYETIELDTLQHGWEALGLNQGEAFSGDISSHIDSVSDDKITVTVFPILLGEGKNGRKTYVCGGQYGEELTI
jgi:flagellin-like protein